MIFFLKTEQKIAMSNIIPVNLTPDFDQEMINDNSFDMDRFDIVTAGDGSSTCSTPTPPILIPSPRQTTDPKQSGDIDNISWFYILRLVGLHRLVHVSSGGSESLSIPSGLSEYNIYMQNEASPLPRPMDDTQVVAAIQSDGIGIFRPNESLCTIQDSTVTSFVQEVCSQTEAAARVAVAPTVFNASSRLSSTVVDGSESTMRSACSSDDEDESDDFEDFADGFFAMEL